MYAMIRRDDGAASLADELVRSGRALASAVGRIPGFITHAVLQTDDGALVSIGICEDAAGCEALDNLLAEWLAERLPLSHGRAPQVISGEVILQKGL